MQQKSLGIWSLPVLVGALGYFVDIYDLLLFSIIRVPSLQSLGLSPQQIAEQGLYIINLQMIGLLVGGFFWGVLGDKMGRMKVLFASIIMYSLGNIANGFAQTVEQYAWIRFFTGIGLAGELGASITLISELLPKNKRGIGTSLVAGIGLLGAVVAFFMKEWFVNPTTGEGWRICYFIGGGMGFLLLFLRVGVLESSLFHSLQHKKVKKGSLWLLFSKPTYLKKYVLAILIGLPSWYCIGILITFSKEFGEKMGITETIDPGKAVMFAYAALSAGDIFSGFISQFFQSRKKAVLFFYLITALGIGLYFSNWGNTANYLYVACTVLGFGTGFWAMFVTMAAEQFGTNIRATVTTSVPNMVRGSLNLISMLFVYLQLSMSYIESGIITGITVLVIALIALYLTEETYHKDLDYLDGMG